MSAFHYCLEKLWIDGCSENIPARREHRCEDNARMIGIDLKLGGRIGEEVVLSFEFLSYCLDTDRSSSNFWEPGSHFQIVKHISAEHNKKHEPNTWGRIFALLWK